MQTVLAEGAGLGPVNKTVDAAAREAGRLLTASRSSKLQVIDWDTVNEKREEWNKRWTREIER